MAFSTWMIMRATYLMERDRPLPDIDRSIAFAWTYVIVIWVVYLLAFSWPPSLSRIIETLTSWPSILALALLLVLKAIPITIAMKARRDHIAYDRAVAQPPAREKGDR